MRSTRDPLTTFSVAAVVAPCLFALGLFLYYRDRNVGDAYKVEEGGVIGLAANLSLIGLTAIVRLIIVFGPQLMILVSIALPVIGALYAIERVDTRRTPISTRKRSLLWSLACVESLGMLGLFIFAIEAMKTA
ncbi:MAG: hypothetical protein ACE37H_08665 [Phycisphaeraceae bacterium]